MKKIFLTSIMANLVLTGCVSVTHKDSEQDVDTLQGIIDEQGKTIDQLISRLEALEGDVEGSYSDILFPVYGLDRNLENEEINFYIAVSGSLNLEGQVKQLADKLSQFKFRNLPIEVLRIEEIEGKKIAVINLKEFKIDEIENRPSWRSGFFQGSVGGGATSITLTKTFLQPDYEGEWIDGVEFYYQSFPLQGWDHVDLSGVKYRK